MSGRLYKQSSLLNRLYLHGRQREESDVIIMIPDIADYHTGELILVMSATLKMLSPSQMCQLWRVLSRKHLSS